jgi:hypothetical protein
MGALYPDPLDGQGQMVFVTGDAGRPCCSSVRHSATETIARNESAQGVVALGIVFGSMLSFLGQH